MEAIFNRHKTYINDGFTIEFNVKNPQIDPELMDELSNIPQGVIDIFNYNYGTKCFNNIKTVCKSKKWTLHDWDFTGRMGGWFTLHCTGNKDNVTERQLGKLEEIIDNFYKNYSTELSKKYK